VDTEPSGEQAPRETRLLYDDFAWAYDLLVTDPVEPFVDLAVNAFAGHGIEPGARLLDAGCGTGRYAVELAGRGFTVHGVDVAPALVAVARGRGGDGLSGPTFEVTDLRGLRAEKPYDAVLCRGVLNDLLVDADRDAVLHRLSDALRPGGVLLLDVREWRATLTRYRSDPVYERTTRLPEGELRFRSSGRLLPVDRRLLLAERIVVRQGRETRTWQLDFSMRCWTEEELRARLKQAGFIELAMRPGIRQDDDRLLCRAVRNY
jgi:SAM-dependent methyltransferase